MRDDRVAISFDDGKRVLVDGEDKVGKAYVDYQ